MSSLFCGVTQAEPIKYIERYLNHIKTLADELDTDGVGRLLRLIKEARGSNKTLFIAGNGGSASTASHMVNDLCIGTRLSSNKIRAVSLVDNISIITAVANDFSYEDIFSKQLEYLSLPGDTLLLISASGNSKNLLKAASYAKSNNIYVFRSLVSMAGPF